MKVTRARIVMQLVETKTLGDGKIEYISLREFSISRPDW